MASTIAAISTGNAPGGIGVIRISGDDAISIASRVFAPMDHSSLTDLGGYQAKYGNLIIDGEPADNCVALVFREPRSYTGENVVELSVHGGVFIVRKALDAVLSAGAVPAEAGEFTKRAFLNGKMDLTQAESVAQLISAEGEHAMKASFNTLRGALREKIESVINELVDCSALMAAWVDYPDEEIPELKDIDLIHNLTDAKAQLEELLNNYDNGQTLTNGVTTAIVGRPNVGKSSLMNMLTGTDKSIVTHIEGTTRDIVEESVTLDGLVLHLMDTAGIRQSDDLVESIGIEKAHRALEEAQLILAVFDSSQPLEQSDLELISACADKRAIAIVNKTDLEQKLDITKIESSFADTVLISAKEQAGLAELSQSVSNLLGISSFDSTAPILANLRQRQNCESALALVTEALDATNLGITFDAINVLIDSAIDELLTLTGKKATTEVVNNIFSKFCVGK